MITCSCHGVSHTTIIQSVIEGLSPALPLSDLSARLRAGSDCRTCLPDLHNLISQHSTPEFIQSAKHVHRPDRRFLLFTDQKALQHIDLEPVAQRCYVVVNGAVALDQIQNDPNVNLPLNLFGLALDHSQRIYLNEKELLLLDWLKTLDERVPFQPWQKITQGQFRKWNPDKINRTTLMRFLTSELMFARQVVEMPELAGVISIEDSQESVNLLQPSTLIGLPRFNYNVGDGFDSEKWLVDALEIVNV